MSSQRYLFDTNVVSQWMRQPTGLLSQRLAQLVSDQPAALLSTSIVVVCELQFGLKKRPNSRLDAAYARTIANLEVLPLDLDAAAAYAAIRTEIERIGQPLSPNDLLIAAHTISLNATLVSADAAFTQVPGLSLENWSS
jgi:tRNA(fMet)-specific endonuclease VapC